MNWIELTSTHQLDEIRKVSVEKPVLIFKHSTTCSISNTTLNRLERNWKEAEMPESIYYLDLLNFRGISNQIAEEFKVQHESPQVLIIQNGKSVYDKSHFDITYASLKDELNKLESVVKN